MRVAACEINPVVGDLDGNLAAILRGLEQAEAAGCDIAAFPELAITGYPPEDLVLKPRFINDNLQVLEKLAARTGESLTKAVINARRERLVRETGRVRGIPLSEELRRIGARCAALPVLDARTPEQILGYDEQALPG